jgi:outer membrane protein assembly factor BamE (lipoprotein component of BamABCDE complex)
MHHLRINHSNRQTTLQNKSIRRVLRTVFAISLCAFFLGLTGCIVPLPDKVSQGHRYSAEALAFLDTPGVTRAEVLASLGTPLLEHESRTLLYQWEQTPRVLVSVPTLMHGHSEIRTKVYEDYADKYGLFIAYDARGQIEAHEVRKIHRPSLEEACVAWQKRRERNR